MPEVVLITGVSRYLGGLFAARLSEDRSIGRIIGVDVIPPAHPIGRADFIRADIRGPMLGRIITQSHVDTVVHMNVIATPTGGRVTQKETNVIGTMQLLAACQKAPSVRRLVVKSSAAVYGSSSRDPAMFTEDMGPKVMPRSGFGKDSVEVEGYVRGFARRRPDVDIVVLRFANVIGPGIRTPMTDYFALPLIPVPLGFDARLQFAHEVDAVEATYLAAVGSTTGVVNVAGDGVITVLQGAALARRPVVFVPMAGSSAIGGVVKRAGLADFSPDQLQLLAHGRGLDTTRMRAVLGLEPRYTTRQAFETYAEHIHPLLPGGDHVVDVAMQTLASGASIASEVVTRVGGLARAAAATVGIGGGSPATASSSPRPTPAARPALVSGPGPVPAREESASRAASGAARPPGARPSRRAIAEARRTRPPLRVVEGDES